MRHDPPAIIDKMHREHQSNYSNSITNHAKFWTEQAQRINWFKPFNKVCEGSFSDPNVNIKWFSDGVLNACYNCVDRHLESFGDKTALIWVGNEPGTRKTYSFQHLYDAVCQFTNGLKAIGVKKGDSVVIYLPMIPESVFSMLACARLGAIHTVVFAGFSAESLRERINDTQAKFIITANEATRDSKLIPLKTTVDTALQNTSTVNRCVIVRHTNTETTMRADRDIWYHELIQGQNTYCPPEPMHAEDPFHFIHLRINRKT